MKNLLSELDNAFKAQGDTSELTMREIPIICRMFMPGTGFEWFIYEKESEDVYWAFANLNDPLNAESGTISLEEITEVAYAKGLMLEIDRNYKIGQETLEQVFNRIKED